MKKREREAAVEKLRNQQQRAEYATCLHLSESLCNEGQGKTEEAAKYSKQAAFDAGFWAGMVYVDDALSLGITRKGE